MNLASIVLACAVCFGDPKSSQTQGANMAIFTLLGVTGIVLGGFIALIVRFALRARRAQALPPVTSQQPQIG